MQALPAPPDTIPVAHPVPAAAHASGHGHAERGAELAKLALGAIGIVYGDIGTSPLYALRECMTAPHGVAPAAANIFGVLSLVFWSITLVVSVKYLFYVMRADNDGEGGVLALMALVARMAPPPRPATASSSSSSSSWRRVTWTNIYRGRMLLIVLGLF